MLEAGARDDAEGMLSGMYEWLKAFHIIAVIAWMAGMLYLPRLFVYHCEADAGLAAVRDLQGDGAPAARGDHQPGDDRDLGARPVARLAGRLVRGAAGCTPSSCWCSRCRRCTAFFARCVKDFAADRNRSSQKFYRIINEVPTVLMIVIVILVIVKPF